MERKHAEAIDIYSPFHLKCECIDSHNGIYIVQKSFQGTSTPIHVQFKIWGDQHRVTCELNSCQVSMDLAWKADARSYQCVHLQAVSNIKSNISSPTLTVETLQEIVRRKGFGSDEFKLCVNRQNAAKEQNAPLSVESKIGTPTTKRFISVYEPKISSYCKLGRIMVTYDTKKNLWHCPCLRSQRSCIHKYIGEWHLFQTHPELYSTEQTAEDLLRIAMEVTEITEVTVVAVEGTKAYPPNDLQTLEAIVKYISVHKKIPRSIPDHLKRPSTQKEIPKHLIPEEMLCHRCPDRVDLSAPVCITNSARVLSTTGIVEDIATYYKYCPQCNMMYRYQEWSSGLHNFNDHLLMDMSLCLMIRHMLQVHTSVTRVAEYLELSTGVEFPSPDVILQIYLHFEALTDHEYEFSCVRCGDHPPVVIMDIHRQTSFHLSASDLTPPPEDFHGEVDADGFWEAITLERLAHGFITSLENNLFAVSPSYSFWAPWIGRNTRRSDTVLNSEFQKEAAERHELNASENRLRDELAKQTIQVLRTLCRECGVDNQGSRADLLLRLYAEMRSKETYDKIFEKVWSSSGGWAVIMCLCGIVYSIKCVLRAESPRDFTDLLLSWKHIPNVIICNFAHGLATHTNSRQPSTFTPFEGQLMEPTPENIREARAGTLRVSLLWLTSKQHSSDPNGHPSTGSSDRYVLYDRFHKNNAKEQQDALRKMRLVPQLASKVKSHLMEQLFARLKKSNYFLNMAPPSKHVFMIRNIIHQYNVQLNEKLLKDIK